MPLDLQRFRDEGYLHVPRIIDDALLDAIDDEYGTALDDRVANWSAQGLLPSRIDDPAPAFADRIVQAAALDGFSPDWLATLDAAMPSAPFRVLRPDDTCQLGPALLRLLTDERLLNVLGELLGDEITASGNQHVRVKLPEAGDSVRRLGAAAATPWHEDAVTHMPEADDSDVITCWVALVDVPIEAGCLVVAPGLHQRDELYLWPLNPEVLDELERAATPVPVAKGDIVLMNKRLPHASLPNRSGRARYSADLRFHPTSHPNDRPWWPAIPVRSADPTAVVRDAVAWRTMWEEAKWSLINAGQAVPGRGDWARSFAHQQVERWDAGDLLRWSLDRNAIER